MFSVRFVNIFSVLSGTKTGGRWDRVCRNAPGAHVVAGGAVSGGGTRKRYQMAGENLISDTDYNIFVCFSLVVVI